MSRYEGWDNLPWVERIRNDLVAYRDSKDDTSKEVEVAIDMLNHRVIYLKDRFSDTS